MSFGENWLDRKNEWSDRSFTPPKAFSEADLKTGEQAVLGMLIAGGEPTPKQWLGVLTADEAKRAWSPGTTIWPTMPVERSKDFRKFYLSNTDRAPDGKARVTQLEPIVGDSMFNAAFVRAARMGEILRLSNDEFLLQYQSKSYNGTTIVARVNSAGKILWTADTGIGALKGNTSRRKVSGIHRRTCNGTGKSFGTVACHHRCGFGARRNAFTVAQVNRATH